MTTERETLRIIGSWMEDGRTRLPDHVLDAVLDQLPATPQRRPGWSARRITRVNAFFKYAITAAAVAVAFVGLTLLRAPVVGPAATASPVPSPSSSVPLPPPLTERFDSKSHGISMNYPAGWQTRPASERWTDGVINFGAPGVDIIFDPARGEALYFAVASEPSGGRPNDVWSKDLTLPDCPGGHAGGEFAFDGAVGWVVTCGGGPLRHSALLTNETHGYAIVMYLGDAGLSDTYTSRWFVSVLETLDLRAEDAP